MNSFPSFRPTVATIDLSNLAHNFRSVQNFIGKDVEIMAVVKANAYGHGAIECARTLVSEGAKWLAVAIPEEGLELRSAGISAPILCLGGFWSGQETIVIQNRLTPVIYNIDRAAELDREARRVGTKVNFHLKVDTGMGRIGLRPEDLPDFLKKLQVLDSLFMSGVLTHFAAADDLAETEFTARQITEFEKALAIIQSVGHDPQVIDLANSPAAVVHPRSRRALVRLGGVLYGLGGDVLPKGVPAPELKPVMSVSSAVSHLKTVRAGESVGYGRTFKAEKDTKVATVPIGYHDGIPRSLSNQGSAIIKGKRVPIIGRISMDWITLDVTEVCDIMIGDEVVFIGEQSGITILSEDVAALSATISYEVTCGINDRVRRHFIRDSEGGN